MHLGSPQRIHHLNCATFEPWRGTTLVTHVLLLELEHGLALVDTGIGTRDVSDKRRLGRSVHLTGARLSLEETAAHQLRALGFAADDVTDVVATHLDYDHVGGLSDFPNARLHTTAAEFSAASHRTVSGGGLMRYRRAHINGMSDVSTYGTNDTAVLGLGARSLQGLDNVFLLPMPGHTAGHAAVAVLDPQRGWLVHAGDAFMHRSTLQPNSTEASNESRRLRVIEKMLAVDVRAVANSHAALVGLSGSGVRVFCSHDDVQFRTLDAEVQSSTAHRGRLAV